MDHCQNMLSGKCSMWLQVMALSNADTDGKNDQWTCNKICFSVLVNCVIELNSLRGNGVKICLSYFSHR